MEDPIKICEKTLEVKVMTDQEKINAGICPDCSNKLSFEGGCVICHYCGLSLCS